MSFEIQELPDVIKIISLLILQEKGRATKKTLKDRLDKICSSQVCVDSSDFEEALKEMRSEDLVHVNEFDEVRLTDRGALLSIEWEKLFVGDEPVMETVAGLTDGSITSLVVILSSFLTGLEPEVTAFAALLTIGSVALTNFSSFYLGGKTEEISDMISLQRLINYSLSDIPDKEDRSKSLTLISRLFTLLRGDLEKSSLKAAMISGITTFLAGVVPISLFLLLPTPLDIILSLGLVGAIVIVFLVRYRARRSRLPIRVTLIETVVILILAVMASLLLGHGI